MVRKMGMVVYILTITLVLVIIVGEIIGNYPYILYPIDLLIGVVAGLFISIICLD